MNVLIDYHHGSLFKSLYLLFEKRLGYKVFRPIGYDWYTSGYWKIAEPYGNAQDTIGQYLDINDKAWDSYANLNGNYKLEDGIYHVYDPENNITHNAITLEQFKEMQFDLVVASHPLHGNWEELLKFQPKAKFIQQMGNENQITEAKNVLSSVWQYEPKKDQNVIYYHQEFDDLGYTPPTNHDTINSFVLSMPESEVFQIYKSSLPEFKMKGYGLGSPDGPVENLIKEMRDSAFGWHIKFWDGYGHLIHTWAMLGRPLIIKGDYYKGKTGGLLLEDGVTCIDIDKHSLEENIALIKEASKPENHIRMCENMRKKFEEVCNFNNEAQKIKEWLDYLI